MSKNRPGMKGTLDSYEPKKGERRWLVSATDTLDTTHPKYRGPVAEVWSGDDWLHIQTDKYEGHVMINIEALPQLRQALGKIARKLPPHVSQPAVCECGYQKPECTVPYCPK